jgi:putative transposase
MGTYRKTPHSTFLIELHLVWITKYRKKVLVGDIPLRTRNLLREICEKNDVHIISGHVARDHVHMFVSIPPRLSVSKLMQYLKGTTSRRLQMEYQVLRKQYWGQHIWARGYFCVSSGNVTDDMIKNYIQNHDERDDSFSVEGE